MFWRPVNSGWKPEPSSRIEAILPLTGNAPAVGAVMPARILSSVLLPAPFSPMSASPSPRGREKVTSVQGVELPVAAAAGDQLQQPVPGRRVGPVGLGQPLGLDGDVAHRSRF